MRNREDLTLQLAVCEHTVISTCSNRGMAPKQHKLLLSEFPVCLQPVLSVTDRSWYNSQFSVFSADKMSEQLRCLCTC